MTIFQSLQQRSADEDDTFPISDNASMKSCLLGLAALFLAGIFSTSIALAWSQEVETQITEDAFNSLQQPGRRRLESCISQITANLDTILGNEKFSGSYQQGQLPSPSSPLLRSLQEALRKAAPGTESPCAYADEITALVKIALDSSDPASYLERACGSTNSALDMALREVTDKHFLTSAGSRLYPTIQELFEDIISNAKYYTPYAAYPLYQQDTSQAVLSNLAARVASLASQGLKNLFVTILNKHFNTGPALALHANQAYYNPGDELHVSLSLMVPEDAQRVAVDIYVAFMGAADKPWFLDKNGQFTTEPLPWLESGQEQGFKSRTLLSFIIPSDDFSGSYSAYAVAVAHGASLFNAENWITPLASVDFSISPASCQALLDGIRDEPLLIDVTDTRAEEAKPVFIRKWDMIFLGDLQDDPRTPEVESSTNAVIPGDLNHMMVYIGRDKRGRPTGIEMSTNLQFQGPTVRLVWFPEVDSMRPAVIEPMIEVPTFMKDIHRYGAREVRRLKPSLLEKIRQNEATLLAQISQDICNAFPYELEYRWSGYLNDNFIYLVDDGRENGSSCTDYWLSIFEDIAGVCIHNTRMSAADIREYLLNDPQGSNAMVPWELDPFPFSLYLSDLFYLGFELLDPPPHHFPCDDSFETGVPLPDLVSKSPDVQQVEAVYECNVGGASN